MVPQSVPLFWTLPHIIDCNYYNLHHGQQFEDQNVTRQQMLWQTIQICWSNSGSDSRSSDLGDHPRNGNILLRSNKAIHIFPCSLLGCFHHTFSRFHIYCDLYWRYCSSTFYRNMFLGLKNMAYNRLHSFCFSHTRIPLSHVHLEFKKFERSFIEFSHPWHHQCKANYKVAFTHWRKRRRKWDPLIEENRYWRGWERGCKW